MSGQPGLFDDDDDDPKFRPPVARHGDPDTSHAAARDAALNADTLRARCYRAIREATNRGLTDFELAVLVRSQQTSAGKRRGELMQARLVANSGRKRPAPSGSDAIVWVAVEYLER